MYVGVCSLVAAACMCPVLTADPMWSLLFSFYSMVTEGMVIVGDRDNRFFGGDGNNLLSSTEADAVLLSAAYTANVHPGYNPRYEVRWGGGGGGEHISTMDCVSQNSFSRSWQF